ncbi:MAG: Uma2 family endonuclease [Lachnospiraceae bacterium]
MDVVRDFEIYTIDDIYALPDGERAELIDGKIYYMAPPNTKHQRLLNYISTEINIHIRNNKGDCEVFPAPFAVFLNENNENYIEPDISVICDKNKISDKGCNGAPDWVIEIVSPGSKAMDYFTKLFKYRTAEVREYWIVDPMKELVTVYQFEKETMEQYSFDEDIPVGIYDNFSIRVQ